MPKGARRNYPRGLRSESVTQGKRGTLRGGAGHVPLNAVNYLRDDDPNTPKLQQAMIEKAMKLKDTNPTAFKRLQEAYRAMKADGRLPEGLPDDLEGGLAHRDLQLAFDQGVPEAVASKSIDRIMNIQGAETKQYPHIAPVKTQLEVNDKRVPDSIANLSSDELALAIKYGREQEEAKKVKQVACSEVKSGTE